MHGGEGDGVNDPGGDLDVGELRVFFLEDRLDLGELRGGVPEAVHEPDHGRARYALVVVAHRHVEDGLEGDLPEPQDPPEDMHQGPGLDVLPGRLVQLEFLGPLHVVALVLHVDAGAGDLQLVQDLDGFQLDEPGAGEPRGDDVLRQLRMGSGGGAHRGPQPLPQERGAVRGIGHGAEEEALRDPEDRSTLLQLFQDPPEENLEGLRSHYVRHLPSLVPLRSSSTGPPRLPGPCAWPLPRPPG